MLSAALRLRLSLGIALALAAGLLPTSVVGQAAPQASQTTVSAPAAASIATDTTAATKSTADSLAKAPKSRSDSVIVVKHHFDHREQIITGSVIMTCLALMMVAMNNYNPR
jgi:hypothetical protein